ncbi:MAG: hypothetical protein IJS31_01385 [Oscillospiraceae bacterium]|nr:hypothetical protein [Oscillospiraceae bacterium]
MCKNTRQAVSTALIGAGAGILLCLLIGSPFVCFLLAAGLIAGGIVLLNAH